MYEGGAEFKQVQEFVETSMIPTLFEFSQYSIDPIFVQNRSVAILFRDPKDEDAKFMKVWEEAAKEFKGQILFAY